MTRISQWTLLVVLLFIFIGAGAASAATILGVAWEGDVVSIDASTGSESSVGSSGFTGLNSLARDSAGDFFSAAGNPLFTSVSTLVRIDPSSGLGTSFGTIAGLPAGSIRALAFSASDTLYAIVNGGGPFATGVADDLYTINLSTGVPTLVGSTGFPGVQALAFAPDGTLYGWDLNSAFQGAGLIAINPADGSGSDVNPLVGEAGVDIQGLAVGPDGTIYGARQQLHVIDPATGAPTAVGSGGYPDLRGIDVIGGSVGQGEGGGPVVPEPAPWLLLGLGLLAVTVVLRPERL